MSGRAAAAAPTAAAVGAEALQLEALLTARAYLYELFFKLFGGVPTAGLLDELLDGAAFDVVQEYARDDAAMAGLAAFLEGLAKRENRPALLDAVRDEYTRLFVGPGELPALPWASPWTSHEAVFFQEDTLAVRAAYRAHGWEPRRLLAVPDDHAALECAFMARVSLEALAAFRVGDATRLVVALREQRAFVSGHVAGWTDSWAKAVRRSKTALLYPQLIEAFAAFAQLDAVFAGEAAFWVEEREASPWTATVSDTSEAEAFFRVDATRKLVACERPLGIGDYELVEVRTA